LKLKELRTSFLVQSNPAFHVRIYSFIGLKRDWVFLAWLSQRNRVNSNVFVIITSKLLSIAFMESEWIDQQKYSSWLFAMIGFQIWKHQSLMKNMSIQALFWVLQNYHQILSSLATEPCCALPPTDSWVQVCLQRFYKFLSSLIDTLQKLKNPRTPSLEFSCNF